MTELNGEQPKKPLPSFIKLYGKVRNLQIRLTLIEQKNDLILQKLDKLFDKLENKVNLPEREKDGKKEMFIPGVGWLKANHQEESPNIM